MKKQILYMLCATALLSSCHIYKSYDRPEDITTSGLYRDPVADNDTLASDTANFGNLPWREVLSYLPRTETRTWTIECMNKEDVQICVQSLLT